MSGTRLSASFRDPSGFVFFEGGELLRQINTSYLPEYSLLTSSGLYRDLVQQDLIVPHEELDPAPWTESGAAAILRPQLLDLISYPYEWCFSALKDAALATLKIQRRALEKGMWLKDASAYNIQFRDRKPVLIDTLSFERYPEGSPWPAYRQFCEHFLAPLVLMSTVDVRLGRLQREYIDGIPLDLCANLAPLKTKLNPALAIHLHVHAKAQTKGMAEDKAKGARPSDGAHRGGLPKPALLGMLDSLAAAVTHLEWKPEGTVWADYYQETNYSDDAFRQKKAIVERMIDRIEPKPRQIWDLGANTGEFSLLAAAKGIPCIAWDIDPAAVERNYRSHASQPLILPLLQDLTNPSPGLGWANRERDSLPSRGPVDAVLALALVHHLSVGNNVPLTDVAKFFAQLGKWTIVEFVPKSDSQTQRLLATRKDIYEKYNQPEFESAFGAEFSLIAKEAIPGTERTLYLYRRSND